MPKCKNFVDDEVLESTDEKAVESASFDKARLVATIACALFTSALIISGVAEFEHIKYELLWSAKLTCASTSILACACCTAFASQLLSGKYRRWVLEKRMPVARVVALIATLAHLCAYLLQSVLLLSGLAYLVVEAVVPVLLFLPTISGACLASAFAWGSSDLRQALLFPLMLLCSALLVEVYRVDSVIVSFICVLSGGVLLVWAARSKTDLFCAWMRPLSWKLGRFDKIDGLHGPTCVPGIIAMVAILFIAIGTQVAKSSASMAIFPILALVYFYDGGRAIKAVSILGIAVVALILWLNGYEHHGICALLLIASLAAFAHIELGPRGFCLAIAALLGSVGICEAVHGAIRYYQLAMVSEIALILLFPLSLYVMLCRPDSRLVSIWRVPQKKVDSSRKAE